MRSVASRCRAGTTAYLYWRAARRPGALSRSVRALFSTAMCLALMPLAGELRAATPHAFMEDAQRQFVPLRGEYEAALSAAGRGRWGDFDEHFERLEGYPLRPYLEYERLVAERYRVSGERARDFVDANLESPLGLRYLGHYLSAAGEQRRWDDYLAAASREPRSESLRCYYYRALLDSGATEQAWAGAGKLWLSGRSVDEACDPLFRAWRKSGGLSDELVWRRALLVYEARQGSLLRYVASLASGTLAADLEQLRRSYREPHRSRQIAAQVSSARSSEVLTQGLVRFSRYDPRRALEQWEALPEGTLGAAQAARLEAAIALRALLQQEAAVLPWIDANLGRWRDDRLTEIRLRWAIERQDWAALLRTREFLSPGEAAEPVWRYWQARALEAQGDLEAAEVIYAEVAQERSYYGFMSADRLGLPYRFNDRSVALLSAVELPARAERTALRVNELTALEKPVDAHAEWAHTLPVLDKPVQLQLASLAADRGWYRLAIDAANESREWDALALRFPLAYTDVFRAPASGQALPMSELMAIARRESAFFPAARSSVGARGLMQLLPSTGLGLARKQGLKLSAQDLYSPEQNVALGSAYYRQLLERFDNNRAVALAAYNAGPNRVKHWVGKGLPLDAWIETIPYRETRDYVKAVLAYSVVFEHRLGQDARLLSAAEARGAV